MADGEKSRRVLHRSVFWWALVAVVSTAVALSPRQDDVYFAIKKNFTIFGALYEELAGGYVDAVDPERMLRAGIEAMLETLDPYTNFINEAQNEDIDIRSQGRMGGVGLDVAARNDRIVVVSPLEGYSAFKQGVRPGDFILAVDGRSVQGLRASDVTELLRGDPGSTVRVRIEREGEPESIEFVLSRSLIRTRDVVFSDFVDETAPGGIGYVRLERFGRMAAEELHAAVKGLQEEQDVSGLILDLRDNPGGLLDAAVHIAGLFVPQGSVVVSTRGRLPETQRVYRSRSAPILPDIPVVVLINGHSASASEIVAGAIQDLDRGVVVGERSFGKGLVQVIRPLPYNTSLKLTTSRYYTPSGRSIQSKTYAPGFGTFGSEVPDSLRNQFRTAGGRLVRDGGGIEPDLAVPGPPVSELESALVRRSAFSRFANLYAARGVPVELDFEVDPDLLAEFQAWVASNPEFGYRTDVERAVETLAEDLRQAAYANAAEKLELVEAAVNHEKERDFERHGPAIRERLRAEILSRFHGETVQIRTSLRHDPQVLASIEILQDAGRYRKLVGAR